MALADGAITLNGTVFPMSCTGPGALEIVTLSLANGYISVTLWHYL